MYQLNVFLHLLAAAVWVGGMLFLALVVVPATRHLPAGERTKLIDQVGRRFRLVGWSAAGVLVVTGLVSAGFRGVSWEALWSGDLLGSTFGRALALKVLLVGAMLAVTAYHDFVLGPAAGRAAGSEVAALRRRARWLARLSMLLALVVMALAVVLVRGSPG